MSRPGFMVYFAEWGALDGLNDAQFRDVFRAAFRYAQTGDEQTIDDPMASLAFNMLRSRLDEDAARYADTVEKRRAAGRISGQVRGVRARAEHMLTSVDRCSDGEHMLTSVQRTNTCEQNEPTTSPSTSTSTNLSQERDGIPTVEEVEACAQSAGLDVDVHEFMRIQNENGWMDSQGRPIRNWKFWLKWYAQHFPKKPKDDPPQPIFFY